ncbi:hypothetical protein LOK49_LG09G01563 [Camellia lanceoleosa]|uniref:Uncharacterized protein n=1 Tax=Camellia lanceoleosa TaxID=1840588 RepID=A0ACC0GG32_9ERIC|nr:hypothetical protein LOK49_LG09G01563 [Camellia lanceoleosa]
MGSGAGRQHLQSMHQQRLQSTELSAELVKTDLRGLTKHHTEKHG